MKKNIVFLFLSIALFLTGCSFNVSNIEQTISNSSDKFITKADELSKDDYSVSKVIDGDTIEVQDKEGNKIRVRLLMVDTPEVHNVSTPEPYGEEASAFTKELLEEGQNVQLEYDIEKLDPYDRTLAYVYLQDGRMLNEELLREGLAKVVVFEPNKKYLKQFKAIEEKAIEEKIGMWSVN
ncbi:thermonuclease family protein [Cytobacillus kochii]|uniref:thermonuclease family protein n=1 Tax=Cytobacillus kochii TaxID=859143 RepID=UPI00247FB16B|nr:thermonuclease family protein [Cytobacillus kochii]